MSCAPARTCLAFAIVAAALARAADAQVLPSEPIQLVDGRLVLGGHVAGTISVPADDGFFNFTDYDHNALRVLQLSVSAALTAGDHFAVLGELQTENWDTLRPYALYARVRPWVDRAVDVQVGRIPPTFGAYGRRGYGIGDPLIGSPLAYQYLTTLRSSSLPASADDLLAQRGRGWNVKYPIGTYDGEHGLPLVAALRWDTGMQMRLGTRPLQVSAAVTNGTLSNPRVDDDNGGKQVAGRLQIQPSAGLVAGVSAATGAYVADVATRALPRPPDHTLRQQAFGFDVEYSRGFWVLRTEAIVSAWDLPTVTADPLRAYAISTEGQYKIRAGLYVAGRVDHLAFSKVSGTLFDGRPIPWDAPVTRVEIGGGYYVLRNVTAKVAYQHNWRDGGDIRSAGFLATQVSYWF